VSDRIAWASRFKALSTKRRAEGLSGAESDEWRLLGERLAGLTSNDSKRALGLRGAALVGCDFFDDFPELYRRQVFGERSEVPGPEGPRVLPGVLVARGSLMLADGSVLRGRVTWCDAPEVDGQPVDRELVKTVVLADDCGALPGPGRRVVMDDGRQVTGHLASRIDVEFVDILPSDARRGVARMLFRKSMLQEVEEWPANP
jgi:hypothetical protein